MNHNLRSICCIFLFLPLPIWSMESPDDDIIITGVDAVLILATLRAMNQAYHLSKQVDNKQASVFSEQHEEKYKKQYTLKKYHSPQVKRLNAITKRRHSAHL